MFKKFQPTADLSDQTTVKSSISSSSIQRGIRSAILPHGRRLIDHQSIYIYTLHGEPLFFQHFDEPYFRTLRLLHKCECAHMMFPGLTSAGRWLPPADAGLPAGTPESAVGIGLTKLGTEEMKKVNKGVAVESTTYKLGY
ncbi:hypothetical protein V8E52_011637 [Russula decolorans]